MHFPVATAQVFLVQKVSPLVSQLTTVAASILHLYGNALISQTKVPLQKLPSSWAAQSLFLAQPQVLLPLAQTPALQTSPTVQPLPSSQLAELVLCTQPFKTSQASVVQGLPSSHKVAGVMALPLQPPPPQVSLAVQALPSSQGTALAALIQPVLGEQLSLVQMFLSSQPTESPPQMPFTHLSFWLQALPSSQGVVLTLNKQPPVSGSQMSSVQELPSAQTFKLPGTHAEFLHKSPTVHALPSLQGLALMPNLQPSTASQLSLVHGLLSLQLRILPATHVPDAQTSPGVHTVPSASHCLPSLVDT